MLRIRPRCGRQIRCGERNLARPNAYLTVPAVLQRGPRPGQVMEEGKQSQSRFLVAAVLSMIVLFGWQYFFSSKKPADNTNANVSSNANLATSTSPGTAQQGTPTPQPQKVQTEPAATTPDTTPNRAITIRS